MMPGANSAKVKSPASGRSASAASVAELMSVTPFACSADGGGQDDEEGDAVGEQHAGDGVGRCGASSGRLPALQLAQRLVALALVHLLDLLRGLPEEQIGADRGAEHGDDHREVVGADVRSAATTAREQRRAPRRSCTVKAVAT